MIRKALHILLLLSLLWLTGCEVNSVDLGAGEGVVLTIRCTDPVITKAAVAADGDYHEDLIKTVDFLFYTGETPGDDQNAVFYIRKDLLDDNSQNGEKTAVFTLVLKKYQFDKIFTSDNGNKAVVYALVNFDNSFIDGSTTQDGKIAGTSKRALEQRLITTDFLAETNYVLSSFLMDGRAVLTYNGNPNQNVTGEIPVTRLAAKLTLGLNVTSEVKLKHSKPDEADETWVPVLHTMRVYLVDGVKTVKLSGIDDGTDVSKFFSYGKEANKRPYVKNDEAESKYVGTTTIGEKEYIESYPMYSYPREWGKEVSYTGINYSSASDLPPEQPYFKLEMDWRREEIDGYSYDRRKYYYKIFIPFEKFERNNWYAFYLNVAILGSETDEGKASITPSCYVLDWQNRAVAINKAAVISKARYLSVENNNDSLYNVSSIEIPFISSHDVRVVPGSVKATRPYYGLTNGVVDTYVDKLHAWVRKVDNEDRYYLEYQNQKEGAQDRDKYEPINWLTPTPTSVLFNHPLENDYTKDDFDYSPYTITFKIVHDDLIPSDPSEPVVETDLYLQYVKEVTITQYPAIYIEATRNRDHYVKHIGTTATPYGYDPNQFTREEEPWGYVYIDGGRIVRVDRLKKSAGSQDPFWKLTTDNNKREYQWRTVWYTGGSTDLFKITVSVLPKESNLVIGDPRSNTPLDAAGLGYHFVRDGGEADAEVFRDVFKNEDAERTDFTIANAIEGGRRTMQHYYMADESSRTRNMLAPSYRVASKFGGTEFGGEFFSDITREYARYRCAGYQEDGFPAGRWRLPTEGEILFIAQLSAKGAFETLFSKNGTYWSANGPILVGDGTVSPVTKSVALLRCVYDSWYWGDDQLEDPTVFVWGDQLK